MKKAIAGLVFLLACIPPLKADIMITNANRTILTMKTSVSTNMVVVKDVKVVWTSFSITYVPPAYTQAVYMVTYMMTDAATGEVIPNTRGSRRMTEDEVAAFAQSKGVEFGAIGQGIGYLLNEYLKSVFGK